MNVFNRIVVSFLGLLLLAAAVAVIVLAWAIPDNSINGLQHAVNWLNDNNDDLQKVVLTAACAAIGLLALILLLVEFTPSSGGQVKVTDVKVGEVTLSTAAISQRVEEAIREVPHISEAKAAVRLKGKAVQVALDLHVDPDANLATVSDEACQAARDVLTEKVHVALAGPPRAKLHYRELRLQRASAARAPSRAAPAPSQETAPPPVPAAVAEPPAEEPPPHHESEQT